MKRIVIMQPYYLAWYGFFEQIKLTDIYVFYDDVQYIKRSLMSRVDIKTASGPIWMTIPLIKVHQGDLINQVICHEESNWRKKHLNLLKQNYQNAPYFSEMIELANDIFDNSQKGLADVTITAIKKICNYYGLDAKTVFLKSSELGIAGQSSMRLFDIAAALGADIYLTGMGALRYMDFEVFDNGGIEVEFIDYAKTPYPQLHGQFNPFVTILDLIANTGKNGVYYIKSKSVHYKDFVNSKQAKEYLMK